MENGKEPGATTDAKSPDTNKPTFQDRFNAKLEEWRKTGCPVVVGEGLDKKACGGRPHRSTMKPKDADGNVAMVIDCENGHAGVWEFKVAEAELQADLARQQAAAKEAEKTGAVSRDPMKASIKITMDLTTQQFTIEQWVPTPGLGIQLAGTLMSHFFAQLQAGNAPKGPKIHTPTKGLVDPKTGRLLTS